MTNADAAARWLAAVPPNLEEIRQAIARIARDRNRASEVIKQIRTFLDKGDPIRTTVNLNVLIEETIALMQPELNRKQVVLQTELAPKVPLVTADRVQLQQVLLNLLLNALDSLSAVALQPHVLRIGTEESQPG